MSQSFELMESGGFTGRYFHTGLDIPRKYLAKLTLYLQGLVFQDRLQSNQPKIFKPKIFKPKIQRFALRSATVVFVRAALSAALTKTTRF